MLGGAFEDEKFAMLMHDDPGEQDLRHQVEQQQRLIERQALEIAALQREYANLAALTQPRPVAESPVAQLNSDHIGSAMQQFWKLTISQRRNLTLDMGLVYESELQLPETDRYGRAFVRAHDRGLLNILADRIANLAELSS